MTQVFAFLWTIAAELYSLCRFLSASQSALADSCRIALSTNSENSVGLHWVSPYLIYVLRPPWNRAIHLASVETSLGAYLANLAKGRLYSWADLSPCLRARNSSLFLSVKPLGICAALK